MFDYKKYRWFFTRSGKLVIGGKSAESNDKLLSELKGMRKELIVMHTKEPGSPFCAIIAALETISKEDKEECATFTGCFSRAWKEGKKTVEVHSFKLSQLSKDNSMKEGTWMVTGKTTNYKADLKLVITKQNDIIRAVPITSTEEVICFATPGKTDKTKVKIAQFGKINREELISALPAGGVKLTLN
jgi:hypothetical protein